MVVCNLFKVAVLVPLLLPLHFCCCFFFFFFNSHKVIATTIIQLQYSLGTVMSDPQLLQINKLVAILPGIIDSVGYSELYGYDLSTIEELPNGTTIRNTFLEKFLVANKFDVDQAAFQLQNTLNWRKTFNPLSAAFLETHDTVFQDLGLITSIPYDGIVKTRTNSQKPAVITNKPATSASSSSSSSASSVSSSEENFNADKPLKPVVPEAEDDPIGQVSGDKPYTLENVEPHAAAYDVTLTETKPTTATTTPVADTTKTTTVDDTTVDDAAAATTTTTVDEDIKSSPEQAGTSQHASTTTAPLGSSDATDTTNSDNLIVTWNLYGKVKNREKVFKNLDAFVRWRVGLMERGIAALDFTKSRTSYMDQVHDYNNVSFFRPDSAIREVSKVVVTIFTNYYPEFPHLKYFINVPRIMSWMFTFTKTFLPKATVDKFRVVSNGKEFALQTGNIWVPAEYGGEAQDLKSIELVGVKPREAALVHEYDPKLAKEKFDPKPIPAPDPAEFTGAPTESPAEVAASPIPDVPSSVAHEVLETGKPEMIIPDGHGGSEIRSVPESQPGSVTNPITKTSTTADVSKTTNLATVDDDKKSPSAINTTTASSLPQSSDAPTHFAGETSAVETEVSNTVDVTSTTAKGTIKEVKATETGLDTLGSTDTTNTGGLPTAITTSDSVDPLAKSAATEVESKTVV